jgi:hypothetical protein
VIQQFRNAGLYPSLSAPVFSPHGGVINGSLTLNMSVTNAAIYYTTNGSDPRVPLTGAVAAGAIQYTGPLTLLDSVRIKARALFNATNWSALNEAVYTNAIPPPLRVTELMFHPDFPAGSTNASEDLEYLELRNIGSAPLPLIGYGFDHGITFTFTNYLTLAAGDYIVLVKNRAAFEARYGLGLNIGGEYVGELSDGGEGIRLLGALGEVVQEFDYSDWYPLTDGLGFSLVIVDDHGPLEAWSRKEGWRESGGPGGSPGAADPVSTVAHVLITEALTHTDPPSVDAIELFNPTAGDVNIGGWLLTDDRSAPRKYRLPANTMIFAGSFLVFDESQFNTMPGVDPSFSLSSHGEAVYLFSADAGTNLTGWAHGFSFGAAANGVSFGRYLTSVGEEHFVAQTTNTLGTNNAPPLVGPIVINEISYHPGPGGDEFVELKNIRGTNVALFDPAVPANTWKLAGVGLDFPGSITLGPGELLLLVGMDPAVFRAKYGISPTVPILGPFHGALQDSGESLELQWPDTPETVDGLPFVPYIVGDAVKYNDRSPWPALADGSGPSLQRLSPSSYGNDPINWTAARPTPGAEYGGGTAPSILAQPSSLTTTGGLSVSFTVSVAGTAPFSYQWAFNDTPLSNETNATLLLPSAQPANNGTYRVVIFNSAGAVMSSNATLVVRVRPQLGTLPGNFTPRPGSNITFSVSASTDYPPLTYQWLFNGTNLSGATNATLVRTNIQLAHDGAYTVVVTDAIGLTNVAGGSIVVYIAPALGLQPQGLTVLQGDPAAFSVSAFGNPLPLSFRWRFKAVGSSSTINLTNMIIAQTNADYTIANAHPTNSGTYSVVCTNVAGSSALSSNVVLTVLADNDGDRLPDDWERLYGFSTNSLADASADPDLDGMTNLAEYLAGTDPTNGLSYLKIDALALSGGITNQLLLTLSAVSNHTYSIICRDDVATGTWVRLADIEARTTNRVATVTNELPAGVTNRFYRLQTPKLP